MEILEGKVLLWLESARLGFMICVRKVVSVLVTIGKNYLVDIKEKISLKLHLIRTVKENFVQMNVQTYTTIFTNPRIY